MRSALLLPESANTGGCFVSVPIANSLLFAAALSLVGCTPAAEKSGVEVWQSTPSKPPVTAKRAGQEHERVLVVINRRSPASQEIGSYYAKRREIPKSNVAFLDCPTDEEITATVYGNEIENPIRAAIASAPNRIDYIVLTKGVPIRIKEFGYSVDGHLVAMNQSVPAVQKNTSEEFRKVLSPYFNSDAAFDSSKFNLYLVTRLDGYTTADAKALVDRSLASKPNPGPFVLDVATNRTGGSNDGLNKGLEIAANLLEQRKYEVDFDISAVFWSPTKPIAGYASWGSNDRSYKAAVYRSIEFLPGAIAETFVSTSARTFLPTTGGQSLIADLISQGVTGVKGYVSEPFTIALAKPEILFERYTRGHNLAESFYMASMLLKWKDVVIGDPLCRPYSRAKR
jgi:uncharacterized protein (TIGR03790 family)